MNASKVKPDLRTYTTLISCYGWSTQRGAPQKAAQVLQHMDELYDKGMLKDGPSQRTFLSLRRVWEISNEPEKNVAIESIDREMNIRFPYQSRD
jgi:hypothetical protein